MTFYLKRCGRVRVERTTPLRNPVITNNLAHALGLVILEFQYSNVWIFSTYQAKSSVDVRIAYVLVPNKSRTVYVF